ncbi:DUF5997 family protein [Rhodococcus sp. 3Y1]
MKPTTAAKKLGVYLEATPAQFQEGDVTRDELTALQTDPPEWLLELRRTGPHPRPVIAAKLGVSIAGLARGGVEEALTTDQIAALLEEKPEWLEKGTRCSGRGAGRERSHQGKARCSPQPAAEGS